MVNSQSSRPQESIAFQDDEQTVEYFSAVGGRVFSVQLRGGRSRSREATSQASPKEATHIRRTAF